MKGKLIYADSALDYFKSLITTDDLFGMGTQAGIDHAINFLEETPGEDAAIIIHARWIETPKGHHCSNCRKRPGRHPTKRGVFLSDFCPHCAAKMDL